MIMAAVAGVTTKKNTHGQITHVTIDVRKHKEVMPMFSQMGLVPKTTFQKECEDAISVEEFRKRVHKKLKTLWPNK
jgi:hypothetical protein